MRSRGGIGRAGWRTPAVLIVLAWSALCGVLPATEARAVIQPNTSAPVIELKDTSGTVRRLDARTTDTVLLVFVKPGDKHTSDTLAAVEHFLAQFPQLDAGLRRWIVVSRLDNEDQARAVARRAGPRWTVLLDRSDKTYREYDIIATPSVVIVGASRKVDASHPGYDPNLEHEMRLALAQSRGVKLPESVTSAPAKPNMTVQMARRMTARGLWDDALRYFEQALKQGPLPPEAQLDLALVYIELKRPDDALAALGAIAPGTPEAARAVELAERARKLKAGAPATPTPPRINR